MKYQTRCGMMQSLTEERKKELHKEQVLEESLRDLLRKKEALLAQGKEEEAAALEEQIRKLEQEKEESLQTRKNLCYMARVVGAGD